MYLMFAQPKAVGLIPIVEERRTALQTRYLVRQAPTRLAVQHQREQITLQLVNAVEIAQQITVNSTQFRDMAVTVGIEGVGEQTPAGTISSWDPKTSRFRIVNDDHGRPGPTLELADSILDSILKTAKTKPFSYNYHKLIVLEH